MRTFLSMGTRRLSRDTCGRTLLSLKGSVEAKSMNEQIEQVSRLMYLLPSIHDDPDPILAGQLVHLVHRD